MQRFRLLAVCSIIFPFFASSVSVAAFQNSTVSEAPEISCYQTNTDNHPWKKKLWDGHEVSLGPTPDSALNPEGACTVAIYNAAGKVVFRSTGFNTRYHEATGMDIDGDGAPDVVLMTDTGGGNHCCWEIEVVSLHPQPKVILKYSPGGGFTFRKDGDGHTVLWTTEGGLTEIGYSMAERPFAMLTYRLIGSKLTNITAQSCSAIFQDKRFAPPQDSLSPEEVARFKSLQKITPDDWGTSMNILELSLQHAYCNDWPQAEKDIRTMWPVYDQQRVLDSLRAEFLRIYPQSPK